MKYTFTINQVAAIKLGDIDVVDCIIIEWLRDICASQSPEIQKNRRRSHTWVSHQYAVTQLPLLGFKDKSAFRKRLQKLLDRGYFSAITEDQKCFVKPLPKMDQLFAQPSPPGPGTESPRPRLKKQPTGVNRVPQAPYSNSYINIHGNDKNIVSSNGSKLPIAKPHTSPTSHLRIVDPKSTAATRKRIREALKMRQAGQLKSSRPTALSKWANEAKVLTYIRGLCTMSM